MENMISSWITYDHSYSVKGDQQRSALSPLNTSFYKDDYKTMISRMDSEKVWSSKKRKTSDPFVELLQLSVLADLGYRAKEVSDLCERKSRMSIDSILKWKIYQDGKHERFMKRMHKLEMKDIERFEQMQLLRKQQKRIVHEEFVDTSPDEDIRVGSAHEQREGDFSIRNISGGLSMNYVPKADFPRGSGQEEDFKMYGV